MFRYIFRHIRHFLSSCNESFREELRLIVRDQGLLVFMFLVPLAYPLLYAFIYTGEVVREVPIAVVDDSRTALSREYLRHVDASADVKIVDHCANMADAKQLIKHRDAYGIVYVPRDFSTRLLRGDRVAVSIYCDMSGMLYYKALLTTNTNVSLDMNARLKKMKAGNYTDREDAVTAHPIAYKEVSLFNPQNGFASFLIPAVLVLILQQTLLLAIGMANGTRRENNTFRALSPLAQRGGTFSVVGGQASAYLLVYIAIATYVLGVVPHLFSLPQIGNVADIFLLTIPYLLASIFFAMCVSALMRRREECMLYVVFTSLPFLFISGVSWPGAAMPAAWKVLSWAFPSTFGINGFLKINNMGATFTQVSAEWWALWAQVLVYALLATYLTRRRIRG